MTHEADVEAGGEPRDAFPESDPKKAATVTSEASRGSFSTRVSTAFRAMNERASTRMQDEQNFLLEQDAHLRRNGVFGSSLVVTMSTLNFFSLSAAFALSGWAAGVIYLLVGWLTAVASSTLIFRVYMNEQSIRSYPDAMFKAFGPWGYRITWVLQWVTCWMIGALNIVFVANSWQALIPGAMCQMEWILVGFAWAAAVALLLPTFRETKYLYGVAGCFLFIAFVGYMVGYGEKGSPAPDVDYTPIKGVSGQFSAAPAMAFAYYSSSIYFEVLREMKEPHKFYIPIIVVFTAAALTMFPAAIAGFYLFGSESEAIMFQVFTNPTLVRAGNVAFLVIFSVALCYNVLAFMSLESALRIPLGVYWKPKRWNMPPVLLRSVIRGALVSLQLLFALMFPFLESLQSLVGALGISQLQYTFPVLMAYKMIKRKRPWYQHALMVASAAFGVFLLVCGMYGAITSLITDVENSGGLFNIPCE